MTRREWITVLIVVTAFGLVSQLARLRGRTLPPPPLPRLVPGSGTVAPDFTLPDLAGSEHRLADLAGEVVFLNFWATWCAPCREELPILQDLHEELAAEGLRVVAVSVDGSTSDAVARFVDRHGVGFPVLHDRSGEVARRYAVRAYPTSMLIDRSGRVVARVPSAWNWTSPDAIAWLRPLIEEASPGLPSDR